MLGLIGEDDSDVETLKVLVRRLVNNDSLSIRAKGYSGCAEMLRKGALQLKTFCELGCKQLIVCYDSDGASCNDRIKVVKEMIIIPSAVKTPCVVIVPIEELEAWILADIEAVTKVFSQWRPKAIASPEGISSPKEYLEKLSRCKNRKPRYSHAIHNSIVAEHLNLDTVYTKCPSFRVLKDFVCPKEKTKKKKSKKKNG